MPYRTLPDVSDGLLQLDEAAMEAVADDRMAGRGIRRIYKSRYDAISCYIYSCKGRPVRGGF
jgi:hypothetical protein